MEILQRFPFFDGLSNFFFFFLGKAYFSHKIDLHCLTDFSYITLIYWKFPKFDGPSNKK